MPGLKLHVSEGIRPKQVRQMPGMVAGLSDLLVYRLVPIPQTQQGYGSEEQDTNNSARDQDVGPGQGGGMGMTVRVGHGMAVGSRGQKRDGEE